MSIRTKGKIIAGTPRNGVDLLDFKWSDHLLDDISWLRADTFSWQSGDIYVAVYNHLVNDYNNRIKGNDGDTGDGWYVDTINSIKIHYIIAPDGHKIAVANNETSVQALYESAGIAWYYILDRENKRFKLPRTKFGFTGLRDGVGKYVEAGLPNITGALQTGHSLALFGASGSGALNKDSNTGASIGGTSSNTYSKGFTFDASRSNSIYGNSSTVQPKATQMYLYFYVGNSVRNEHEIDVGALTEAVNSFDVLAATDTVNETRDAAIVSVNAIKDTSIQDIETARDDSVLRLESMGNALNHTNITNCVTKIPQDIKLEFNNGTAILKAGSKVYMPNGPGVFDTIVIPNDIKLSGWTNLQGMMFVAFDGLNAYFTGNAQIQSGSSGTISGGNVWYDTTTNKIFRSSGSAWDTQVSFPICIVSCSDGNITSVDQVFNGFGYIGSTVFALPGVEGLIPNGRNEDGSLKTIKYTLPKVTLLSSVYNYTTANLTFAIASSGSIAYSPLYTQDTNPNKTYALWFNPKENKVYISTSTTDFTEAQFFVCGSFDRTAGTNAPTLSNFKTKPTFCAVDYNDFRSVQDHSVIAFQKPTSSNKSTWFRIYSDGWVEQGGTVTGTWAIGQGAEQVPTITLPIPVSGAHAFFSTRELYCFPMGYYFQNTSTIRVRFGAYTVARTLSEFKYVVYGMKV